MAIPAARVKVELLRLKGVAAVVLGAGHTRYARASFEAGAAPRLQTGRSRPIPAAGGDFDLTLEAAPWHYEVSLNAGTNITVTVEIGEDRGDAAPPGPTSFSETVSDPWTSGVRRTPQLELRVTTALLRADAAFLARAAAASGISGSLAVPQGFIVEIVDIDGLYKPDLAALPPTKGSNRVAGYISNDNQGRIFTNRRPDGTWAKDTQYIDVKVRVTAFGGPTIPAGAKIKWTLTDPDDPTNDASEFHREAGRYVDANDYNAVGDPIGAHPDDNTLAHSPGNANESLLFGTAVSGSARARWAQATGGPAASASSRTEAQTPVSVTAPTTGASSVRIHCPNVLGTNLLLKVQLIGTPIGIPVHHAFTGVMTMWSRIDVEVVRMAGAHSLSGVLGSIPPFFRPACVQLDFQLERTVTGALDKAEMAASHNLLLASTRAWVNNAGVFTHRGQGGWFFLGAARLPNPLPAASPPALFTGITPYTFGTTGTDVWVEVAGSFATADYMEFTWTDLAGATHSVGFSVESSKTVFAGGRTIIFLKGNDVTPDFTGHDADGSLAHAYATQIRFFPRHRLPAGAAALTAGGFGVPVAGANIEISPPGAIYVTGISPSVPNAATGVGQFFAGRTVLFTHTQRFSTGAPPARRADFNARVLSTVVHEFLHAFGMPHKCGNWSWHTPRQKSCCMNYFNTWLLDSAHNLIPGTVGNQGDDMCGRHLMEVRRVHLERNPGLSW